MLSASNAGTPVILNEGSDAASAYDDAVARLLGRRTAAALRRTSPRRASSPACSEVEPWDCWRLFRRKPSPSAQVAKERLRIIVSQERGRRGGPDYLPLLRRELLEVIRKYVKVDPDAVKVNVEKEDGHDVLRAVGVAAGQGGRADRCGGWYLKFLVWADRPNLIPSGIMFRGDQLVRL